MAHHQLTATQALEWLRQGTLSAMDLLRSCLDRIAERESVVQAWEYLNLNGALYQAHQCDLARAEGKLLGALHGIPIGIKDTFATVDMPTGWGTPIHQEQQFNYDAAVVERLRAAGAVLVGKTVTTEYAIAYPSKTRNPHHPDHTPGASSSGSAAAVADKMVPLAIGTQMMGSILRPAAYCGVFGLKPSFGLISRFGLMPSCRELDHVGMFARSLEDIGLLLTALVGVDARDPDCYGLLAARSSDPLVFRSSPPKFALIRGPHWQQIEATAKQVLLESVTAATAAGAVVTEVTLPPEFDPYFELIEVAAAAGMAASHGRDYDHHADQMSPKLRQMIERGRTLSAIAYAEVRQAVADYHATLTKILAEHDAILTPVTIGPAPQRIETGSPIFCALWTLCGLPAISIPAGTATNGLPLGVQLVGRRLGDWELLRIANWLNDHLTCNIAVPTGM